MSFAGKEKFSVLTDKKIRNFILLQTLYNGFVGILTLFINTFIMKAYENSSLEVLFYNLVQAITQPLAMITSFALSRKKSYLFTQRMGFVFYLTAMIVLCVWGEGVAFLYPLFGILISFGAGYYFGIYSVQMMSYTTDENRDMVSGATTALCSVISLLLPLFAGYIISVSNEYIGYRIVFAIETVIAFVALFVTTRLAPIQPQEKKISIFTIFKRIVKDRNGRKIMIASGLDNCRSFTVTFYMTMLIYKIVQSEILVSVNSTIGAILGIVGATLYGVIVEKNNRLRMMLYAVLLVLVPCGVMCFSLNVYVLFVFYAVYSLTTMFLSTPVLNTHFKVMEGFEEFSGMGAQIHTVREIFVSTGRVLGILLVLCLPQTEIGIASLLAVLMLTAIINVALVRNIEKTEM